MSGRNSLDELTETRNASVSRRAFLQRALLGAGTVVASGAALGAWSRAAHASSARMAGASLGATGTMHASGMDMPGMDKPGMDKPGHDMSAMNRAKLRDVNAIDVDQVRETPEVPQTNAGVIDMDGDFYKAVRLPPKPNAKPLLDGKQIDELERHLACPCPCNLDVFTCRTTDFSCGNSPAVHDDVQKLVAGGYSADEIMKAMIGRYGNNILMAPPKEGVNLIAWFGPFVALGIGAVAVNALLRSWRRNADAAAATASTVAPVRAHDVGATAEEMERLRVALRDDRNK